MAAVDGGPHRRCGAIVASTRVRLVLRIGSLVLRIDDLERQAGFWQAALGYVRRDEAANDDFVLLRP